MDIRNLTSYTYQWSIVQLTCLLSLVKTLWTTARVPHEYDPYDHPPGRGGLLV